MFRSSSSFDRLLERATSNLLLEPDWNAILQICDSIRSGDTNAKYAINAIKKKFYHENPHVVLYGLTVIESCVKNCGTLVHEEVATRAFMEEIRDLLKHTTDENIKKKILEMLQTWGMAFRNSPRYRIVTENLNLMKAEGWKFPAIREAEAMFEADTAPEWAEGDVCNRCRVAFGMMTRQHHCRACGQVFCGKCSSKFCPLPKFGIEREVRVCDPCFEQYGPKEENSPRHRSHATVQSSKKSDESTDLPAEYLASPLSKQSQVAPPKKTEAEIKEEEELQLALAISQSEAEEKENQKKKSTTKLINNSTPASSTGPPASIAAPPEDLDPELVRYLDRNYWEQKEKEKAKAKSSGSTVAVTDIKKSITITEETSPSKSVVPNTMVPKVTNANDEDLDEFVTTLRTQVEIFVNRMKSNSSRGRSITNDSSVQTLFMNTMAMHSKLLKHIQDQEDKRVHYEGLQDKLAQVKDARAALEALREEERERKRREAEEAERQRQIQMREKLELMRKKKTEYLQYQRQLALQKMQEQEREMLLRQEHSKQQYMQHPHPSMYPGAPPQMYNPYYPPGTYGPPPPGSQPGMQYQSMPMQPPPPAAGTMAQPPNSMVAPTGPQMAYGMPPPGSATPSTTEATGVPSTTFNMASMGAALTHPGGQQPPVYQTAPQGMPQPPVMTQMTPGMQMPPAPQQQDPQAPKQGSNAQALAELISFD